MNPHSPMAERGQAGNQVLGRALAYARHGWPVFPCQPGRKVPATSHGFLDATTDQDQITAWFKRHPERNLAVATGWPGPDVLDVDKHETGHGFTALNALARAGLADGAAAWVRTPSGGVHGYFAGSAAAQRPPARTSPGLPVRGRLRPGPPVPRQRQALQLIAAPRGHAGLDWQQAAALLEPNLQHQHCPAGLAAAPTLAGWPRGWPGWRKGTATLACSGPPTAPSKPARTPELDALAAAARQAGLGEREIRATLDSAAAPPGRAR